MNVQLIRNATLLIRINETQILVDPMLGEKGASVQFNRMFGQRMLVKSFPMAVLVSRFKMDWSANIRTTMVITF